MDHLTPGRRISLSTHRGTIRYVGPVPPSSGTWLGVEWDDPSRGRHSGTSPDGMSYFTVRVPGSGSFIRPTAKSISNGCDFLTALRNKYTPSAPTTQTDKPGKGESYSRKNIAEIEIETPNLDRIAAKTARLDKLKEVGLGGWQAPLPSSSVLNSTDKEGREEAALNVASAFSAAEGQGSIRATCPNIRWLDLSRSLLPDWEQVSLIAGELEA